ncbi:hypothetical protein [Mesorhizobium sp. LNHC209A00]|uniref:hypothetical protein n=1 Tax=Mesorhizobium TaxID=68287 RepID=UPI0012EB9296|nr:hypothetical protein [Mesorhizobium sp. LNHC209A00]
MSSSLGMGEDACLRSELGGFLQLSRQRHQYMPRFWDNDTYKKMTLQRIVWDSFFQYDALQGKGSNPSTAPAELVNV